MTLILEIIHSINDEIGLNDFFSPPSSFPSNTRLAWAYDRLAAINKPAIVARAGVAAANFF